MACGCNLHSHHLVCVSVYVCALYVCIQCCMCLLACFYVCEWVYNIITLCRTAGRVISSDVRFRAKKIRGRVWVWHWRTAHVGSSISATFQWKRSIRKASDSCFIAFSNATCLVEIA